ncbi:IS66 family transposase [Pandoraea iniqua]|uniref:IS66 family transposase n=1 Tax=Pandoraea iniqua TaxID=2508288 RepID=UPI001FE4CE22|nr:IS66 family transposase [Pandoraea iniqua]
MSNALAENAMRCVSPGRKNLLFADADSGGGARNRHVKVDRHEQAQRNQPARLSRG